MDMSKWAEYEQKEKDLRKMYRKKRITVWIVWLIVAAAMNTALILLETVMGAQIMFTAMLILNAFAIFIACRKANEWKHFERKQITLLEQDEPFGKFRT